MFAAFNSILAAFGSPERALDVAALVGALAATDAEIALAHVITTRDAPDPVPVGLDDGARAEIRRLLGAGRGDAGDPPVRVTRAESVAAGLLELVAAHGSDLLVIGTHHRHIELRPHDHTRDALHHVSCAVAVAPEGYAARANRAIRTVGVGYLDDPGGRAVLDTARSLAWQLRAEVFATTVVPASNWPDAETGTGWRAAAAARRMAEIPGVHGAAVEGSPERALAALSDGVDLLVIGSHHHAGIRRFLLSDVADRLSRRSRCPLLVLPDAA